MFSAATTRMQSAGQAAAHSEQPTHFSSPLSSAVELVAAAEARVDGPLLLGVLAVVVPAKTCAKVVFSPRAVSRKVRQVPRVRRAWARA